MPDEVSKARWLVAQEQEKRAIELSTTDMVEHLRAHQRIAVRFLDSLKHEIALTGDKRVLEIGGGPTCIFLALREGIRYAVDPTYQQLFDLYPVLREIDEYKDVTFLSSSIEEAPLRGSFDLIFMLNVLDHVGNLKPVADKIGQLLAPSGKLVVVVDCYADPVVKGILTFFDIDLPHPHHFVTEDITRLFSNYRLIREDNRIFEIFYDSDTAEKQIGMSFYRVDKLLAKIKYHLQGWYEKGGILFIIKFLACYSCALMTASLRMRERPVHPFKKLRLFIFQKP